MRTPRVLLALALLLLPALWHSSASAQSQAPRIRIEGPFAARDGDICVVCNSKLSKDDFAYKINGQRVTVMRGMENVLLASPLQYIRQGSPQPQQDDTGSMEMSLMASWGAAYLLLGLMCGGACAYLAPSRGGTAMNWFCWGLLFSVPAVALLAARRNRTSIIDPADPS